MPKLHVPTSDSKLAIDGKLDEPCWKGAATTGVLMSAQGQPTKSTTEAFVLCDADHLYVGVTCGASGPASIP